MVTFLLLAALGAASAAEAPSARAAPVEDREDGNEATDRDDLFQRYDRSGEDERYEEEDGLEPWVWILIIGGVLLAVGVVGFVLAAAAGGVYALVLVVVGANVLEQLVCAPVCGSLCGVLSVPGLCAMSCNGVLGDTCGSCNAFGSACSGLGDGCTSCSGPSCSGPSFLVAPAGPAPLSSMAVLPAFAAVPAGSMLY